MWIRIAPTTWMSVIFSGVHVYVVSGTSSWKASVQGNVAISFTEAKNTQH